MKSFDDIFKKDDINEASNIDWKQFSYMFSMDEVDLEEFFSDMKIKDIKKYSKPVILFNEKPEDFVKYLQLNSIKASGMTKSKIKSVL